MKREMKETNDFYIKKFEEIKEKYEKHKKTYNEMQVELEETQGRELKLQE